MDHVAIDLGGRQSQICVRSSEGKILREGRVPTAELGTFLVNRPPSRVIVETCAESFRVADIALSLGHEVRVVPSTLARSLGIGARRIKTDRRDAQVLSEVSCRVELSSVHIPSAKSRERKSICGMREATVGSRTKLVNTVRGWLRSQGAPIRSGGVDLFTQKVRAANPQLPGFVERQLRTIEYLTREIDEAESDLAAIAKSDPVCKRLMTVPGIGPLTSVRFASSLDTVERFEGAHSVQSFLGVTPGENSSSERKQRTSITKAGPSAVRWMLIQAAWSARIHRPDDPMVRWSFEVEKRRGKKIAVTALARKLAGILYAIWRDGTVYDSGRGANTR